MPQPNDYTYKGQSPVEGFMQGSRFGQNQQIRQGNIDQNAVNLRGSKIKATALEDQNAAMGVLADVMPNMHLQGEERNRAIYDSAIASGDQNRIGAASTFISFSPEEQQGKLNGMTEHAQQRGWLTAPKAPKSQWVSGADDQPVLRTDTEIRAGESAAAGSRFSAPNVPAQNYKPVAKTPPLTINMPGSLGKPGQKDRVNDIKVAKENYFKAEDTLNQLTVLEEMSDIVGDSNIGTAAEILGPDATVKLAKLWNAGADMGGYEKVPTNQVGAAEALAGFNTKLAMGVRLPGAGSTSDVEFKAYKEAIANLGDTYAGRQYKIKFARLELQRRSQIASWRLGLAEEKDAKDNYLTNSAQMKRLKALMKADPYLPKVKAVQQDWAKSQAPQASPAPAPAPQAAPMSVPSVRMVHPSGRVITIPPEMVQEAEADGFIKQ